ncbi:MAG TPA: aldo/keto reductase [bacterium]|nr:aldo/keto reductase [bacterium]
MERIDRRDFLKKASWGALGAGVLMSGIRDLAFPPTLFAAGPATAGSLEYRTLGRTGLKITPISFGAMRTDEPAVIRRAFDMGINYFDTADCYMNGRNEKILGEALKGVRDKVYIATKVHNAEGQSKKDMQESIDRSLRSLNTDYIDVMQLHNKTDEAGVLDPMAIEVLSEYKKAGKIRFTGVTTHENMAAVVDAAIKSGFYDMALVAYSFKSEADVAESFARATAAGLGIVAMKTQAGGYETKEMGELSPHQAALRWVLDDKNVAAAIPSMINFDQLEENFKVMGTKVGWSDRKTLNRYARAIDKRYCRRCGKCVATCPQNAHIPALNRMVMYAEGYKDARLARERFAVERCDRQLGKCASCGACAAKCVHGIDIAANIKKVRALIA